jgi:DNA-directed RNA polymerase specialized sigma24 family protein
MSTAASTPHPTTATASAALAAAAPATASDLDADDTFDDADGDENPDLLRVRVWERYCHGARAPRIAEVEGVPARTVRRWIAATRARRSAPTCPRCAPSASPRR